MNTKISIIIPVYKVEQHLHRCLDSILSQTFGDYECILVDDNSPDNCPMICDQYAKKDFRFKVIHKKQNEGLPAARKSGLDMAMSDFILHIDSDDWIEPDMIEKMYMKAISGNYDMVWCDYYEEHPHKSKCIKVQIEDLDKITLIRELVSGRLHSAVWNKLTKRQLYNEGNIYFSSFNLLEDLVQTIQYVYYAEKIGYVNSALYHYVFNSYSISNDISKIKMRILDNYHNLKFIIGFLEKRMNIADIEPEVSFRINRFKLFMLRTKETRDANKLFSLYPDSHKYIFDKKFNAHLISKFFLLLAIKRKIVSPYKIFDILLCVKYFIANVLGMK